MGDPGFTSFFSPVMFSLAALFDDWFEMLRWGLILSGGTYCLVIAVRWVVTAVRASKRRNAYLMASLDDERARYLSPRVYAEDQIVDSSASADRGMPGPCSHVVLLLCDTDGTRLVSVHGQLIRSPYGNRLCAECTEAYIDFYKSTCAECGRPILPSEPVADAWVGAPHKYTHLSCTTDPDLYCGLWGKGEFISLHRLEPSHFPPGTRNLKTHESFMRQSRIQKGKTATK